VPAIISQPGRLPEGQVSNAMFTGTDWLATLAGLLPFDIPTDRSIDSVDVARDWMSDESTRSTSVHWSLPTPNGLDHVIRVGNLKLILDQNFDPMALYDLAQDPFEMFDLRAEMPERVSELIEQHRAFMASIENDPLRPK
jgi:arylsulfatase A-like enzyme